MHILKAVLDGVIVPIALFGLSALAALYFLAFA